MTMQSDYKNINKKEFEKIKKRFVSLKKYYHDAFEVCWSDSIFMNSSLLFNSVVSYFIDLKRTKNFHPISNADNHKKAAYMIYWLNKIKPLQLNNTTGRNENSKVSYIVSNEIFALSAGILLLNNSRLNNKEILTDKYWRASIYNLHYRNINASVFASEMYLLECLFSVKKV